MARDEVPHAIGLPRLDRYAAQHEIARGGMGRVLEATDLRLSRTVALKEALTTDPEALARFARETSITARLEHPAIVPLYDAGTSADGTPFYVMRKISGHPLADLVAASGSLSDRLALVGHVVTAAQAIAHAHARGVLHRDLKPTNILVGDFGQTVVIDWGLAKIIGEAERAVDAAAIPNSTETRAGAVLGTPGYMPAEQIQGSEVDARCDVYALGATLFYVLARSAPHAGTSVEELLRRAAHEPARSIADVEPAVPRDLAVIINKALAFAADDRYRDAGELAADLQRFLAGQLVAARHYSTTERLVRFVRKHLVATIAVALLLVGAAVATSRIVAANRETEAALTHAVIEQRATATALDQLRLTHARSLLTTNPTAAIALVKPLAVSPHWREVRAIAHEALTRGATWTTPGPLDPRTIAVAGGHAAVTGLDGSVWLVDLERRTSSLLTTLSPRSTHVVFAAPSTLIAHDNTRALSYSLPDVTPRELPLTGSLGRLVAAAGRVFAIHNGEVVVVELASGSVRALGIADARDLVASPDGTWLAVARASGLLLLEVASGATTQFAGSIPSLQDWSAGSASLVAAIDDELVRIAGFPTPVVVERRPLAGVVRALADQSGLVALTSQGIERTNQDPYLIPVPASYFMFGLTGDDVPVIGSEDGQIILATGARSTRLRGPLPRLTRLSTSADHIVAAGNGRIAVWATRPLVPARIPVDDPAVLVRGAGQSVVLVGVDSVTWVDFVRGSVQTRSAPLGIPLVSTSRTGDPLVILTKGDRNAPAYIASSVGPTLTPMAGPIGAVAVTDSSLVIERGPGAVEERDFATNTTRILAEGTGLAVGLESAGTWRGIWWEDGTYWRQRGAASPELAELGPPALSALLPDGTVIAALTDRLMIWRSGSRPTVLARLPQAVVDLAAFRAHVLIELADRRIARVDLTSGAIAFVDAQGPLASISATAELALAIGGRDPSLIDVAGNLAWPSGIPETMLATLTEDARGIVAVVSDHSLAKTVARWPLALPTNPFALVDWLRQLTNATAQDEPGSLVWP